MVNQNRALNKTLFFVAAPLILGCGSTISKEATAAKKAKPVAVEPTNDFLVPLDAIQTKVELPYLVDSDGVVETQCFEKAEGLSTQPADEDITDAIGAHKKAVIQAIGNWFLDDIAPAGLDEEMVSDWKVKVGDPQVAVLRKENLRFVKDQECIGESTGNLPKGVDTVVSLVGARDFLIKSKVGIGADVREAMIAELKAKNVVLESDEVFVWEVAKDEKGEPKVDKAGEELYLDPDGRLVPESKVPDKSEQGMKLFRLKAENPIYFAYAPIADDYWRREGKKKNCDVYLVWGDLTLRVPECEEFQEASFSVKKKGDDVEVTIRAGESDRTEVLPFDKNEMIQIDDRIIIWIRPTRVEEGVLLKLNSFVLAPRPKGWASESALSPTRVRSESAPKSKPASDKPKKRRKKKKQSDQQTVDDFLSG